MIKILFVIHDLSVGGAEKVLVNLVNNMDPTKFDISLLALFGGGVNEQFLRPHVRLLHGHKRMIPGNSHIMKLFSPEQLYRHYIKEEYDIVVAYLEGPSTRLAGGYQKGEKPSGKKLWSSDRPAPHAPTRRVAWVHVEQRSPQQAAAAYRTHGEVVRIYNRYDRVVTVSDTVRQDLQAIVPLRREPIVLYNTVESDLILEKSREPVPELPPRGERKGLYWCGVGKISSRKGFDRMVRIQKRLLQAGLDVHFLALGVGPLEVELKGWCRDNGIAHTVHFLGYQTNPYRYVAKCDLFVCASQAEGFSTAATEALIVGTPVCTTLVSGMTEMLGEDNAFGVITENDEEALYQGVYALLSNPQRLAHYTRQAELRGRAFSTEKTVAAVERLLTELSEEQDSYV